MVTNGFETRRSVQGAPITPASTGLRLLLALLVTCSPVYAADPITPSGLNTQVSGPLAVGGTTQYNITGGTRPGGGTNLFHSFGEFGVPTNNIANFLNETALPTSNILARVTGGNISSILGAIQTEGFGNANLFLMNPAGLLFGPNATLNVDGVVTFTSANYLRLADNARFNAIPNAAADALLSASPVAAFGFLGPNPGAITVQGSRLTVSEGTGLSLVGGNITMTSGVQEGGTEPQPAQLAAPNGKIQLAGAASPGEFDAATLQASPDENSVSFTSFGTVSLAPGSLADVTGTGKISIRGGSFVLDVTKAILTTEAVPSLPGATPDVIALSRESAIVTNTSGPEAGAEVQLVARRISLDGASVTSSTTGTGAGGTVTVNADQIQVLTGGLVTAATSGPGNAGSVTLTASDSVTISGQDSFALPPLSARSRIDTSTSGAGHGGDVTVSAGGTVSLTGNQSGIFSNTSGTGDAGNIAIVADTLSLNSRAQVQANALSGSEGIGGNIDAQVRIASLTGNSGISTNTKGPGDAGDTRIHADESITLTDGGINSGSFDSGSGAGNAGPIWLTAPVIALQNGKVISSSQGPGNAGNILLEGTTVSIEANGEGVESTVSAQTEGPGRGGDITIRGLGGLGSRAADVTVAGGSQLLSMTAGDGRAGDIAVATERLDVNTSLVTSATRADGAAGHMVLDASESARITAGAIESVSDGGAGTAGQITITTPTLTVEEGGIISASSTGPGNAGNITINAGRQFDMSNSSVKTDAAQASGGNIDIQAIDRIRLVNSTISTSVLGGAGGSGNITIDPNSVILQNSQILARAVQGAGGNITITTPLYLVDSTSTVSASSQFGRNGTVNIQSPTSNLSGTVSSLPSSMRQAQGLQTGRCAALADSQSSSLIVAGRETMPTEPGGWLPSPLTSLNTDTGLEARGEGQDGTGEGLVARGKVEAMQIVSLRRLTPAGFLTQSFAESGSTGCRS